VAAALVACLAAVPPPAAAGRPVSVQAGARRVSVHPFRQQASYVREVYVHGATRARIVAALAGPATGPDGFAPRMQSATPVADQYRDGHVTAEKTRLPGLPEAMGSTVSGDLVADGMVLRMRDGLVTGDFRITVSPERRLPDGDLEVRVVEIGTMTILRQPPRSLAGIPAYLLANATPFGWMMQAAGGAAVSRAHIWLFELEAVLTRRLNARGDP
jgi:hypothetical protein